MELELEIYETANGKCPFELWINGIKEVHTRAKIYTRHDRLKLGNFGDCKTIEHGVCELRIAMAQEYAFIMGGLATKSSYFYAGVISAPKQET